MENTKDMTKGSPWKTILTFALPVFLSNFFQQLYNSVDSAIVGNILGPNSLAAVSSSGSLIFLFTGFFGGLSVGAGVLIARYFGAKEYDKMREAIHTAIAFGLCFSVFLTILGSICAPFLLQLMEIDAEVLPESTAYFRTYFFGVGGVVMYNTFAGILNALGNSRRSLRYLIISSLLNVALDLLFIGGFRWGVGAASAATAMAQFFSAFLCFLFLIKEGTIYQVKIKEIRFNKKMLLQILRYGIPSGVQNSVIALANTVVQRQINSFGPPAMAGCGSYSKIEGFAFLPINSFNLSLTTYIGQNLGAKEYKRVKEGARFGIFCSVVLAELIGVAMFFGMPYFARIFTNDPASVAIACRQARTCCLFYFLLAFSHAIAAVCRGAGKAIVPMAVMLAVWCALRVTYVAIAISIAHEIVLLFIAYPLTWSVSSIIFLIYYKASNWMGIEKKKKNVFKKAETNR